MKWITASAFKARCLAVMKEVHATGEPVVVTKRGAPLVKVVPPESGREPVFGFLAGQVEIVGDIESPVTSMKQSKISGD